MSNEANKSEKDGVKAVCVDERVRIFKAQPVGDKKPGNMTIVMDESMPEVVSLNEARERFKEQGKELADALWSVLPGGTLDALLIEMLERKRSLFVVQP